MEVDDQGDTSEPRAAFERKLKNPKERIEQYFLLLTKGCGNVDCSNQYCASSSQFLHRTTMSPNAAAIEAVKLVKQKIDAECPVNSPEPMNTEPTVSTSSSADIPLHSTPSTSSSSTKVQKLSYPLIKETIELCQQQGQWSELVRLLGRTFSRIDVLIQSFRLDVVDAATGTDLDIVSLEETYSLLFSLPEHVYTSSLIYAITNLSNDLFVELRYRSAYERDPHILNVILIILSLPCLDSPEFIEQAYPEFLKTVTHLPLQGQRTLVQTLIARGVVYQRTLLTSLHQLLTIRVYSQSEKWSSKILLNNDDHIVSAAKVMKLVYYASLMGGKVNNTKLLSKEKIEYDSLKKSVKDFIQSATEGSSKERSEHEEDPLALALGFKVSDCVEPLIPRHEFVNDIINDTIEMDHDFKYYRGRGQEFSFIRHSFLLTTATKSMALYYDSRVRMINERRVAILSSLTNGGHHVPYLRLRVRRDHLIADALIELEVSYMENPNDLKKQLFVEFLGEQGIDEGGVSKEFFQLITEEIFNPDFGMFIYDEQTRQFWFNPDSYENDAQFILVGMLLGLAIYNNIILDIKLPMVVYRKLMGKLGTLKDMQLSHPVLYTSLKHLLAHEGNVEEDMMITFALSRTNMFGEVVSHPLKEGGDGMFVTNENREEYCELYADHLLNNMVEKQFKAFYKGFHMVTEESPLEVMFAPEEVEELVCGSVDWDIKALEETTEYDGGFDNESETIKHFWQVVHAMPVDNQRKMLQFVSGSDRVPVGGLAKLKMVIARNGPDTDRLPTSHTCFNVLLLPDYKNLDKLKERLLLAITHAKGFGML